MYYIIVTFVLFSFKRFIYKIFINIRKGTEEREEFTSSYWFASDIFWYTSSPSFLLSLEKKENSLNKI